jgi:chromosome segregation ATPase
LAGAAAVGAAWLGMSFLGSSGAQPASSQPVGLSAPLARAPEVEQKGMDPELEKQLKDLKDRGYESPAALLAAADRDHAVVDKLTALLKKENFDQADLVKGLEDFLASKNTGGKALKDLQDRLKQESDQLAQARKSLEQLTAAGKTSEEAKQSLAQEIKVLTAREDEAKKAAAKLTEAKRQADARLSQVSEELKKAQVSDANPAAAVAELVRERAELDRVVQEIAAKLKADRGNLPKAIETMLAAAQQKDPTGLVQSLQQEISRLSSQQTQPGASRATSPVQAEAAFGTGLSRYRAGQYSEAEKDFDEACQGLDQDARFLYYRGLSRLAQGKREAAVADFRQAAQLERAGRPDSRAVRSSLERIQGEQRQLLNQYRP